MVFRATYTAISFLAAAFGSMFRTNNSAAVAQSSAVGILGSTFEANGSAVGAQIHIDGPFCSASGALSAVSYTAPARGCRLSHLFHECLIGEAACASN